jgi:hypothetical protein
MWYIIVIGVTAMTNNRIITLPDKVADNDKYDYVYDYNYYITEDNNYYDDRNFN